MSDVPSYMQMLYRRVLMMLSGGRINLTDDSGVVQRMQVKFGNNQLGDNIPRLAEYGFASNPPPGSDCITVSVYGDRSISAVVATGNQLFRMKNLANGEVAIYDSRGRHVYLRESGIEIEAANSPVSINNCTVLTINAADEIIANTPLLKCTGDIIDNYNTQTHTMAQMRQIYNTHTHGGVQAGGSNTAAPNQTE